MPLYLENDKCQLIERCWYAQQVEAAEEKLLSFVVEQKTALSLNREKVDISKLKPTDGFNLSDGSSEQYKFQFESRKKIRTPTVKDDLEKDKLFNDSESDWMKYQQAEIQEIDRLVQLRSSNSDRPLLDKAKDAVNEAKIVLKEKMEIKDVLDFFQYERAMMTCLDALSTIEYLGEDNAPFEAFKHKINDVIALSQHLNLHAIIRHEKTSPEMVVKQLQEKINHPNFDNYLLKLQAIQHDSLPFKKIPGVNDLINQLSNNRVQFTQCVDSRNTKSRNVILELKKFVDNFEGTNSDGIKAIRGVINKNLYSKDPVSALETINQKMHEQGAKLAPKMPKRIGFFGMKGRTDGVQAVYQFLSKQRINSINDLDELKKHIEGKVLVHGHKAYEPAPKSENNSPK